MQLKNNLNINWLFTYWAVGPPYHFSIDENGNLFEAKCAYIAKEIHFQQFKVKVIGKRSIYGMIYDNDRSDPLNFITLTHTGHVNRLKLSIDDILTKFNAIVLNLPAT